MAGVPPTLSACLIVRNEALVLGRCLASLAGVVDEIVVVDTCSTDDTPDIAARFGARIRRHAWQDDFAAARNAAIDAAACDWILTIDADEYLAAETRDQVRTVVARTEADGLLVTVRNLLAPGELIRSADSAIVRLFRRHEDVRFAGIIHEAVDAAITGRGGRIAGSPIVIVHDGYASDSTQGSGTRAGRNLPLLLRAAAEAPGDPYLQFHLGATYQHLGRHADARRHLQQVWQLPHDGLNTEILANAAVRLAQLALVDSRHESVVRYAGRALELEPHHVLAHYLSGLALARLGRRAAAVTHLERVKASGQAGLSTAAELDALIAHCVASQAGGPPGAAGDRPAAHAPPRIETDDRG
jgi:tetratricopeptide (TPR) repeat protein